MKITKITISLISFAFLLVLICSKIAAGNDNGIIAGGASANAIFHHTDAGDYKQHCSKPRWNRFEWLLYETFRDQPFWICDDVTEMGHDLGVEHLKKGHRSCCLTQRH